MEHFKASAQYGDWEGTVSADGQQPTSLHDYLDTKGLKKPGEFVLAVSFYTSEQQDYDEPHIEVFLLKGADKFETAQKALSTAKGPVPVRVIDIKLTTEEFLNLFKRFNVMMTWHGLDLEKREFTR